MKTTQQYADETLDAVGLSEFKQPLLNVEDAFVANGWDFSQHRADGFSIPEGVEAKLFADKAMEYYEPSTGKFARDVTGPFGNNAVAPNDVGDPERKDIETENGPMSAPKCFIVGVRAANDYNDEVEQKLASEEAHEALAARVQGSVQIEDADLAAMLAQIGIKA